MALSITSMGQVRISEAELMFFSRHVWRGEQLGTAVAMEPSVTATSGRFNFSVWAAFTPNKSYSEIDLIPSYQSNYFELSLLDYYNPVAGEKNGYLNFDKAFNRHSVEITLDNYAIEKYRLKWMAGTFILGDKNDDTGRPFYSTYLEFSYPFSLWQIDMEPSAGFTPAKGYYAGNFAIVSTSMSFGKEIDINDHLSIPLTVSFIHNPYTSNTFVTFASGIAF
ncbi:MAG: hypothetical protein ACM3O8_06155 [Methylococcaceae bacterium]|nr:hypothetical protein [Prolixibacteraceae bacterium]